MAPSYRPLVHCAKSREALGGMPRNENPARVRKGGVSLDPRRSWLRAAHSFRLSTPSRGPAGKSFP
jgi:hypothetical protein